MGIISDLFNIDLKKAYIRNFWVYTLVFMSTFCPGYLILFIYFKELFLTLDTLKLIILSVSYSLPVYLLNVSLYYLPLKKGLTKLEEIINLADLDISNIKGTIYMSEETHNKFDNEKEQYEYDIKMAKFQEEKIWKHVLFSSSIFNCVLVYGSLIFKYKETFIDFIKYLIFLETLFVIISFGHIILQKIVIKFEIEYIKKHKGIILFLLVILYMFLSSSINPYIFSIIGL